MQFLGQRNDVGVAETTNVTVSANTTTAQAAPSEGPAEKKQAIAKALGATATRLSAPPSRGKKVGPPAKELVSIEEDDIPF